MASMRAWQKALGAILIAAAALPVLGAAGQKTSFRTGDGVELAGEIYSSSAGTKKAPLVILVHQLRATRASYEPLIRPLQDRGFVVIAIDQRGHGESTRRAGGADLDLKAFSAADWAKLPSDIRTVVDSGTGLPGVDSRRVAVVGASIGANAAAIAGSADARVKTVVLLSPGLDYHGLKPESAMRAFKGRSLIVAGKDDQYSLQSSRELAAAAPDRARLVLFDAAGHGTDMFASHKELVGQVADWLKDNCR